MIAGHHSPEPAHQIALKQLGLEPIQDLQMRLGEATGALASVPILDLAVSMMDKMAFIEELQP
jgi:NaMN:DMB phosphoribosyltransferase